MPRSEYREIVEEMKLAAEKYGDQVEKAGVTCSRCGIDVEVPFLEVDSLADAMQAHENLCPRK